MSKEMRSMNIEKDNVLWQYGHPHREFKEMDTWNTQINKRWEKTLYGRLLQ